MTVPPNEEKEIFLTTESDNLEFDRVNLIQITFDNDFLEKENALVELKIVDTKNGNVLYSHKKYLIHFFEYKLNMFHTGKLDYAFSPLGSGEKKVVFTVFSKENEVSLKNFKINYLVLSF